MAVNRIEAVVDAISRIRQANVPESEAYQLRNPLLLKSYARLGRHQMTSEGLRVFNSLLAGYKAAVYDCGLKLKGLSRAGLKSSDPIESLFRVYGLSEKAAHDNCLAFIRRALADSTITLKTPLSFFLEGNS